MSTTGPRTRNAWEDRFRTPTYEQLRDLSNKQVGSVFEAARQRLGGLADVQESLVWLGVPWRWSLEYRCSLDAGRAWAVLVLQPNKPEIVVPLAGSVLTKIPLAKLPRTIRDGLRAITPAAGVYWPTWECQNKTQVDEVLQVLEMKRGILLAASRNGTGSNG